MVLYTLLVSIVDGYLQVTKIVPRSFADKCGMIEVGDRLVEINSYPLEGVDLIHFSDILSKSNYPRDLIFCPINPWDRDTAEEKVFAPEGIDAMPNVYKIVLSIYCIERSNIFKYHFSIYSNRNIQYDHPTLWKSTN